MHYRFLYFSKELPTREEIREVMAPYNYDNYDESNYQPFYYDYFHIGGRYGGRLKLKVERGDETYQWEFTGRREGRLFLSSLIKRLMEVKNIGAPFYIEDECYDYLGCHDGFLYVDGAPLKDLVNLDELSCYGYIGVNGELHMREVWNAEEKDFLKIEHFDEDLKLYIQEHMDCFVTVLDVHG